LTKAENFRRVLPGERREWIPVDYHGDLRYGEDAYTFIAHRGASAPEEEGGYDLWGVFWTSTEGSLLYPVEYPATTLEEALAMPFPDIHNPSLWEEARAEADAARDNSVIIAFLVCALWERLWSLVGFETALIGLVKEPELASAVLQRIADWQVATADHFMEVGVGAARITDDYGAQNDLLMKPDTWRRVIRPHLARMVDYYQQAGVPVILHSCGKLARIMDDLMGMGFAAFNIQTNINDLVALRKRYGRRFCVWGGVSTQLLTSGTPSQVKEAVRQAAESLGRDGGLILAPDQYIPIPEENLRAFYEATEEVQTLPTV